MNLLDEAAEAPLDSPEQVRAAALLIAAHIHSFDNGPAAFLGQLVLEDAKAFEKYILTGDVTDPRTPVEPALLASTD